MRRRRIRIRLRRRKRRQAWCWSDFSLLSLFYCYSLSLFLSLLQNACHPSLLPVKYSWVEHFIRKAILPLSICFHCLIPYSYTHRPSLLPIVCTHLSLPPFFPPSLPLPRRLPLRRQGQLRPHCCQAVQRVLNHCRRGRQGLSQSDFIDPHILYAHPTQLILTAGRIRVQINVT